MAFEIQWTGPTGPASTRRKDPVDALKYAVEMLEKGYADVVIVDVAENGQVYAPAEIVISPAHCANIAKLPELVGRPQ